MRNEVYSRITLVLGLLHYALSIVIMQTDFFDGLPVLLLGTSLIVLSLPLEKIHK